MLAEAIQNARSDVLTALKQASAATGSDFDYLLGTAMRESGLRPGAKAPTSSASGLFQFTQQTWLGMIKQYGAKYGLGSYAGEIRQEAGGRYCVGDAANRQAILALRNDAKTAALMAGEYANQTRSELQNKLGRHVCSGELYVAHFLGPQAACRLIQMIDTRPHAPAAGAFPEAARANHSVFYRPDGTEKTVREVYDWAVKQPPPANVGTNIAADAPPPKPSAIQTASSSGADTLGNDCYDAVETECISLLPNMLTSPLALSPGVVHVLASLRPPELEEDAFQRATA